MAVDDSIAAGLHLASRVAGLAISLPGLAALTALGAGVVTARKLVRLVWGAGASTPRHHAASVRERTTAAARAAARSGLLSPRDG